MIEVENLTVEAGSFRLEQVSLNVPEGTCAVLMGRTGCGKTTLLEAICGLRRVTGGTIRLHGVDASTLRCGERGIGLVPQESALFPRATVREHLAFGPSVKGWSKTEIEERIEELAVKLRLEELLDRRPRGLSGGEKQRVSLGRAIASRPSILCLDEPLNALDEDTYGEMLSLLQRTVKEEAITTLHITHDSREAEALGDLLFRMEKGSVIPLSPPSGE